MEMLSDIVVEATPLEEIEDRANSSVRIGLGRTTTAAEVDFAASELIRTVRQLQENASKTVPPTDGAPAC